MTIDWSLQQMEVTDITVNWSLQHDPSTDHLLLAGLESLASKGMMDDNIERWRACV